MCGEGSYKSLGGGLVFGFVVVASLVGVVVVDGEESCFVGGNDMEGFPWYRRFFEGVQGETHCEDGGISGVACA